MFEPLKATRHFARLSGHLAIRIQLWRELGSVLARKVLSILDSLPDNCSIDDVLYHLYVAQAVSRGDADVAHGRTVPHAEVEAELRRKWLLGVDR